MFSDLATFRHDLDERLAAVIPDNWRRVPSVAGVVEALVPVVYTEFTEFETTERGVPLPRGTVMALADLVVTTPKTTADDAEDDVDEHVLHVLAALDPAADLYWDRAKKERLAAGQLAWRISLRAFVATPTPESESEPIEE